MANLCINRKLKRRFVDKKRRDNEIGDTSTKIGLDNSLEQYLSVMTNRTEEMGILREEYLLLPAFGRGSITKYIFNGVELTFNKFLLDEDLLLRYHKRLDQIQLAFLIEGEKIISLEDREEDIICENQDSYMVHIGEAKGKLRISGGKAYREVGVRLSEHFLENHGLGDADIFKEITDCNLVLPISDELLQVLGNMEVNAHKGIAQKLFLQAKVLELLVMQMANYKRPIKQEIPKANTEMVKRLYEARRIIAENLDENFSIKVLSRKVMLNEYLLKKEFKRIFGHSVNAYSRNEKMKHAKNLLQVTQLPIYQIAEEIGYKNATHFSVAFKRFTGEIPRKYRARL
jgi:AraC-like DNA-binding protein